MTRVALGWGVGDHTSDPALGIGPLSCSSNLSFSSAGDEDRVTQSRHLKDVCSDTRPIIDNPGHLIVGAIVLSLVKHVLIGASSVISERKVVKVDETQLSAHRALHPVFV